MAEIRVVLWDVGGVIQPDDRLPPRIVGVSRRRFAEAVEKREYQDFLKGKVGVGEAARFLLDALGKRVDAGNVALAKRAIFSALEPPRQGVVSIIKRIKPGLRRMILSTMAREVELFVRKAHKSGIYGPGQQYLYLFKPANVLFSNRIGATKWERTAFLAVRKVCGIHQRHWLFIEDRKPYLELARKFGVGSTVHYTNAKKLKSDLARLGVLAVKSS